MVRVFSIVSELGTHHHNLILKYFQQSKKNPHTVSSHFPLPSLTPMSSKDIFTFRLYRFTYFTHSTRTESYTMWPFVSGLFHLACFFKVHVVAYYQCFIPFYCQVIFHCMDIHFVYPPISRWTFGLFLSFFSFLIFF